MNRLVPMLSLGLFSVAVHAQSPAPADPAPPAVQASVVGETRVATPAVAVGEAAAPVEATRPKPDPGCVRESGTRLKKRDKNGCTGAPGSSYSRADIDRTGAVDTADAIRKLSTSGTVSRGN